MDKLIENIIEKKFEDANKLFESAIREISEKKIVEMKKMIAAKMEEFYRTKNQKMVAQDVLESESDEQLEEAARIKIIRARIRGGKVQRRKRISNVPGMTIRGGRLIRMTPAERRKRKLGQRLGKLKRRAKKSQMLRRRKISLMRRTRLGI
jgi:hypothetical protein